jgi:hypothetical protein
MNVYLQMDWKVHLAINSVEGEWIVQSLTFKTARERGIQGHAIMVSH